MIQALHKANLTGKIRKQLLEKMKNMPYSQMPKRETAKEA